MFCDWKNQNSRRRTSILRCLSRAITQKGEPCPADSLASSLKDPERSEAIDSLCQREVNAFVLFADVQNAQDALLNVDTKLAAHH